MFRGVTLLLPESRSSVLLGTVDSLHCVTTQTTETWICAQLVEVVHSKMSLIVLLDSKRKK
jgi:hypothetical protein